MMMPSRACVCLRACCEMCLTLLHINGYVFIPSAWNMSFTHTNTQTLEDISMLSSVSSIQPSRTFGYDERSEWAHVGWVSWMRIVCLTLQNRDPRVFGPGTIWPIPKCYTTPRLYAHIMCLQVIHTTNCVVAYRPSCVACLYECGRSRKTLDTHTHSARLTDKYANTEHIHMLRRRCRRGRQCHKLCIASKGFGQID